MKVRIFALSLLAMLLISVNAVFAQDETIVDIAAGDEQFSTLVELLSAAGLVDALAGEGPFTVFAPTNDAFAALPSYVTEYIVSNPDLLTQVLLYHVVEGAAVMSGDLSDGMTAATMDMGNELTIGVGEAVTVDQATVVAADVEASNGVIHVIDSVLVPPITLPQVFPDEVEGDIITAGSSTVGPLSVVIADNFDSEGYTGEITIDIIGSGAGLERFCEAGETDIANASRPINQEEIEACGQLDPARTPIEFRVGTDALAVVVNPANDFIESASIEELANIFGGAEFWSDVNPEWPEEPILRFIPGTDSGTFDYFVEEVFEEDPEPIQQTYGSSTVQLSEDDNVLLEGVANNEFAIGFFGYAYYNANQEDLKILNIDGVEPVLANVDNNTYPLARPLFIYSDAGIITEKPQVGQFISYYLSTTNDVIEEVGYFPANPFVLNIAKLIILSLTDGMMEDM